MNYFCRFRRDLKKQRAESLQLLENHIGNVLNRSMKEPTPAELASLLYELQPVLPPLKGQQLDRLRQLEEEEEKEQAEEQKSGEASKDSKRGDAKDKALRSDSPIPGLSGVVMVDIEAPQHGLSTIKKAYHRHLKQRHESYKQRRHDMTVQWNTVQDVLQKALGEPRLTPAWWHRQYPSSSLASQTLEQSGSKPTTELAAMTRAELLKEKRRLEAKLTREIQALQEKWQTDIDGFCNAWKPYFVFEQRWKLVQKLRKRSLKDYHMVEKSRLEQQYRELKTLKKKDKASKKRTSSKESKDSSNSSSKSSKKGSSSKRDQDEDKSKRDYYKVRVTCRHQYAHEDEVRIDGSRLDETVGQFKQRVLKHYFRVQLANNEEAWAFIIGGPRMRDELKLKAYDWERINQVKFVIVATGQKDKDKDKDQDKDKIKENDKNNNKSASTDGGAKLGLSGRFLS